MPTQMTARALLSIKSSPSLFLPRHTARANITAPLGDSSVSLLFFSCIHQTITGAVKLATQSTNKIKIHSFKHGPNHWGK